MEYIKSSDDSFEAYIERVREHLDGATGKHNRASRAAMIARSAEDHFARFEMPCKRYLRAMEEGDLVAAAYEKRVMLAILYEVADTAYLVMNMLDFSQLKLDSSTDGYGLVGDDSAEVVSTLGLLEEHAKRRMRLENRFEILVDFTSSVDEKEGITFKRHAHWKGFVSGDIEESFNAYFAKARQAVTERLNQQPLFWKRRSIRQYLQDNGYRGLNEILRRLEQAQVESKKSGNDLMKGLSHQITHIWKGDVVR